MPADARGQRPRLSVVTGHDWARDPIIPGNQQRSGGQMERERNENKRIEISGENRTPAQPSDYPSVL